MNKPQITPLQALEDSNKSWKEFFAFSDLHCPEHDNLATNLVINEISNRRPDVVVFMGDLLNAESASRFENEAPYTLEEEFTAAAEVLSRVEQAAGARAELVFIEGNHDNNIGRVGRVQKGLRDLVDYRKRIPNLANGRWRIVPYINDGKSGIYRLGQVTFCHGFSTARKGDMEEAVLLGVPNGLYLRGHSHSPLGVTQALLGTGIPLPYWYGNTGTLGPLKPEYANRSRTHDWGRGYCSGVAKVGRAILPSPQWRAKVEVFEMATNLVRPNGW